MGLLLVDFYAPVALARAPNIAFRSSMRHTMLVAIGLYAYGTMGN
jgi:hypothetical protein